MPDERISEGDLLVLVVLLSVAGAVVSGYLTWQWYEAASASWCDVDAFFSCSRVRESPYSAIAGVPTAVVGLAGFVALLVLAILLLLGRRSIVGLGSQPALLGLALVGAMIGAGLTVIEITVIHAVCLLCAAAFAIDLVILGLAFALRRGALRLDRLHGDEEVLRP